MALPLNLLWSSAQTKWKSQLDPLMTNPLTNGQFIPNVALINGVTVINHKLGRQMLGYQICGQTAVANIYYSQPFNSKTLTLTSSAAVTVNLWVF